MFEKNNEEREIEVVVSERGDIYMQTIVLIHGETLREALIRHGFVNFLYLIPDIDNPQGPEEDTVRIRIP